jgi:polyhydroxyalkanoate synthesis regulator protein
MLELDKRPPIEPGPMLRSEPPILIKRYANRRLYCPGTGTYLSRQNILAMAEHDEDFVVIDAASGDDITSLFRPILIEH